MVLVGLIIAGFFHSPLYPISNGLCKSSSFSTIEIHNIPTQNHTYHQPQLLSPLIVVKKAPKNILLPLVREKLFKWIIKVSCRVFLPGAYNTSRGCLTYTLVVGYVVVLGKDGFRYACVLHSLILSQNTFSGPAKGTLNIFNLILISKIKLLSILSPTSSDPNVLNSTVFWRLLKD